MIKRGNLIIAVLVCGVLPLLGAMIISYWLVARTSAEVHVRAEKSIIDKTHDYLAEIAKAKQMQLDAHLQKVETDLLDFANDRQVINSLHSLSQTPIKPVAFRTSESSESLSMKLSIPVARQHLDALHLSNVHICDISNGKVIYSNVRPADFDRYIESDASMVNKLHKQFVASNGMEKGVIVLPFSGKLFREEQLTYIGTPIFVNSDPVALAVFEVSINRLASLVNDKTSKHDNQLLVNHLENTNNAVGPNDIGAIATLADSSWNLSVVSTISKQEVLRDLTIATDKAATLTSVLYGGSQAAIIWTVLVVIAAGTYIANHLKQPLQQSANELQLLSQEGSDLLLDGTNKDRKTLLKWIHSLINRLDTMSVRITGERAKFTDLVTKELARSAALEEIGENEKANIVADHAMREVMRRSQQSLASASNAARLAEQAISKLGTQISPEEVSQLKSVVTNISEQSKWLDENSTWMEHDENALTTD